MFHPTLLSRVPHQDMIIAGEYSDEGKSGKSVEGRPQFQQKLQDIEEEKELEKHLLQTFL